MVRTRKETQSWTALLLTSPKLLRATSMWLRSLTINSGTYACPQVKLGTQGGWMRFLPCLAMLLASQLFGLKPQEREHSGPPKPQTSTAILCQIQRITNLVVESLRSSEFPLVVKRAHRSLQPPHMGHSARVPFFHFCTSPYAVRVRAETTKESLLPENVKLDFSLWW